MTVTLRSQTGTSQELPVASWRLPATTTEIDLLAAVRAPVLDVGCGPGRLVVALAEQGRACLGVDSSPVAAAEAIERGAAVLCRSVFDRLPGEGRWATVLLVDGNIGIGGNPLTLLRRVQELLSADGVALVETGPPGAATELSEVRVEARGEAGPWFPWAWVSADALDRIAPEAGFIVEAWLRPGGRWVARLRVDYR